MIRRMTTAKIITIIRITYVELMTSDLCAPIVLTTYTTKLAVLVYNTATETREILRTVNAVNIIAFDTVAVIFAVAVC